MECSVCGGKEFQTDVGKQMCMECGTENTQYVEVALGDEEGLVLTKSCSHRLLNITNKVQDGKDKKQKRRDKKLGPSSRWTTYEALSLVLQEWTSILVQLGASSSLPKLVLKLWAGYLSKIEVAFISCQSKHKTNVIKRPKLNLVENRRDMQLLYQEKEYVNHAEISAHPNSKKFRSESGNKSLKRIMNRAQRRFLKAKIMGRAARAASVASNLSAILLATEDCQEGLGDEAGASTSNRGIGGDGCSSGESSAMSCSSQGSSSVGGKGESEDDEPHKRRMFRSHYVLRWLKNKKNMYLQDDGEDIDCVFKNLEYDRQKGDQLAAALQAEDISGSDANNTGNDNNGGGRMSNNEKKENPTTANIEGVNITSYGCSRYMNSFSPKSTHSVLSPNDAPTSPGSISLSNETDLSSHNYMEDKLIMNKQMSSQHLSQKHSISFDSVPGINAKLDTQPNAGVHISALNDLNQSLEIFREMDSDGSGEPGDCSVAANISSLENEDEQSYANDSYEDVDFTKIVNRLSSMSSSKLQQNAVVSNRQPSLNTVEKDLVDIMSTEKNNHLQSSLTGSSSDELQLTSQCIEYSFLSDSCDDLFKGPNFEPVSSSNQDTDIGSLSCLEDDLEHLDHRTKKMNQPQSANSRKIEKLNVKRKQNKELDEEKGIGKRQRTLGSRSVIPKNKSHSQHSFKSAKEMIKAAKSSSAQGSVLPEQGVTTPFNIDELDHTLQRKERSPQRKQLLPNGKVQSRRPVSKDVKAWFRVNEPLMPTFSKLLALLYIACRINSEEVLLLDLLRWCYSNHLPFTTAPYILPDSIVTLSRYDLHMLSQCKTLPSHYRIRRHVARLSLLMEVQALPLPRLETVSSRLLHGLCLPEDLQESVVVCARNHLSLFPPTRLEYPGVELLVGAVIIFLLKASWGLDGVQEQQLSAEVQRVNNELERLGSSHRLFCWKTWHRHMMKVQWFNKTVDPGLVTKVEDSTPLVKRYQAERLAQYFWTHGIWRRPRTTANRDDKQAALLDRLLRAQHLTLPDAVGEARLFQASYLPLTGRAAQYRHCWRADKGQDKEEMKQVAESISSTSFESHQSGFLRDAASNVRRELLSLQSCLTVSVHYGDIFALPWTLFNMLQKNRPLLNGTTAIDDSETDDSDSDSEEGVKATSSFPSQSTNDGHYLESRKQDQLLSKKQEANNNKSIDNREMSPRRKSEEDASQYDELEQSHQCTVNMSQTAPALEELVLSNPMERMWLLSSFPRTKKTGVVATSLPPSYRWLVRLIAELCCTSEQDVLWHASRLEKAVTGVDSRVNVFF